MASPKMRIAMDGNGWIAVSNAAAAMPNQRVVLKIKPSTQAVTNAAVMAMCVPWFFADETVQKSCFANCHTDSWFGNGSVQNAAFF